MISKLSKDVISGFMPPFIQIDFAITKRCNARCIFCKCWRNINIHDKEEELPGEIWINTARKIKDFITVEFVCIGGGEPFLYEDIFEVIEGLDKLDLHTVVVTNGSLFSDENCKKILDTGIRHIDFSIDGFSEKHNSMRGIPNLFKKCVDAMFVLKKINPKIILGVSTVICGENISEIPEFTEWALKELPIDAINFQAYNQVVIYEGKDWWRNDPLWPKDKGIIMQVLDYLAKRTKEGAKIANNPLQFEKFKNYLINPDADLNIRCPAGTFNLSFSYKGDIIGCIAEGGMGNVKNDDPIKIYKEKFSAIRKKASSCKENCHFLINCYFPLHWKRWDELVKDMVKEENEVVYKPGKIIIPPEVREITSSKLIEDYPDLIKYEEHKDLDVIGKYDNLENRKLAIPHSEGIPLVYLCGDTSEVHRWGVDLDENDFFKQVDKLKELLSQKAIYHIIVGARRTNFHRLHRIYNFIRKIRRQKESDFPLFDIKPLKNIKRMFFEYLKEINEKTKEEGIEFRIIDTQLEELLTTIEKKAEEANFNENNFLRALGPVCKDVFIGPRHILLDLAGRCNLNCVYCRRFSPWNKKYWRGRNPELFGFLDFEVIRNVLSEAKEIGTEIVLLVGGGEPTLHPKFLDIINLIKDLGMTFNFSTNGALLDLYNKYLVDGRCITVTVSLSFASGKDFKLIRPNSDMKIIPRIEKNIQDLADLKCKSQSASPNLIALYAICKYNYKEITEMAHHAKRLRANSIWYQLVHLEGFSRDKLCMNKEEMENVRKSLEEAKELCKKIGLDFRSFIEFEIEHYDEEKGDWSKRGLLYQGCFVGWHFAFIHLRREVFMCCGIKTIGILDKRGKGFKDLWHSDVYRRYRNDSLIMHRENPLTIYGKPLYEVYCDSCDNHDQNTMMINLLKECDLEKFVER